MAKKKNELSYLQMPLPEGRRSSKMTKRSWSGLNYRQVIDTGALSMEKNISTLEAPYLTPSQKHEIYKEKYSNPIGLYAFDDILIVIYNRKDEGASSHTIYIDYINWDGDIFTGVLKYDASDSPDDIDNCQRSIVQFNKYDVLTDPLTGQYMKKLLIFPDKVSIPMRFEYAVSNPKEWDKDVCKTKSRDTMYVYYDDNDNLHHYYTIQVTPKVTEKEDGSTETTYDYSAKESVRVIEYEKDDGTIGTRTESTGYFHPDNLEVELKEYENDDAPYLPPDTASHNYYYKNTSSKAVSADTEYGKAIYRWYDDESDSENSGWKVSIPPTVPDIKHATVHLSRVFGVSDDRVYASGYNDYSNWNLDTVGEYNEANAWCSAAQSNTKADGDFTGITTFQNHVVCFKRDFMHEVYNTKNPFRIQDIYAEGAVDNRSIQDVDGRLIFVSDDNVKIYTGSNPRIISYYLNMTRYINPVSGTDGRNYYLYCEDADKSKHLFVYDTICEQWSEQCIESSVLNFAHNKNGMYMLCDNGTIYRLDTGDYGHKWSFETDLITNETVDIKHIKKIQMLAKLDEGASMDVYMLYDGEEFNCNSHLVYSSKGAGLNAVRVKPRQTASYGFKLHVEGYGYVRLHELELFIEGGGALYV